MGKKSKAPQIQESQNERALAEVSQAKWNRYKSLYRPVEQNYINEVSKDASGVLRGRNTADVAQASAGSFGEAIALGQGGAGQLGATVENMGAARTLGATAGNFAGQQQRDSGRLNALKIGSDMAADAQGGLAMAARASNTEAIGRARAQAINNDSKSAMTSNILGTALGAAATGYMRRDEIKWPSFGKTGATRSPDYVPSSSADRRGLTNRDGAW